MGTFKYLVIYKDYSCLQTDKLDDMYYAMCKTRKCILIRFNDGLYEKFNDGEWNSLRDTSN